MYVSLRVEEEEQESVNDKVTRFSPLPGFISSVK